MAADGVARAGRRGGAAAAAGAVVVLAAAEEAEEETESVSGGLDRDLDLLLLLVEVENEGGVRVNCCGRGKVWPSTPHTFCCSIHAQSQVKDTAGVFHSNDLSNLGVLTTAVGMGAS